MRTAAGLFAIALSTLALIACGDDEGASAGREGEPDSIIRIETPPGKEVLAYTVKELSTEAGEVVVEFNNPQPIRHNVLFEDSSGEIVARTDRIFSRAAASFFEFEPGEYTFFCSLGAGRNAREGGESHREAGMEGTLIVE